MIIEWEGKQLNYDAALIDVADAMTIKAHTGFGMRTFEKGVDDADPVCLQALLWVIKKQNGERVPSPKQLNFSVHDFYAAVIKAHLAEMAEIAAQMAADAEAEQADPTVTAPASS